MLQKIASKYLEKVSDYSDTFTHDFYDRYYSASNDELAQYNKYYKALNKVFKSILKGKHGHGYNVNGLNEKDKVSNIFIDTNAGLLSYKQWHDKVKEAIDKKDIENADDLTWPRNYYVQTHGTIKPDTSLTVSDNKDILNALYAKDPNLQTLLNRIKDYNKAQKEINKLYREETNIAKPFIKQQDAVDKEERRVLKDLEKEIDRLDDKRYSLWEIHGFDSPEEKEIDKQLGVLFREHEQKRKPFVDRTDKILKAMDKAIAKIRKYREDKGVEAYNKLQAPF